MIQVHLMEQLASPDLFNSMVGYLSLFLGGPACAPVFLLVMGYYLLSGERSRGYYFRRGALLFAGGIILNVARSSNLLIHIVFYGWQTDPWPFIFGADILPLAGLSVFVAGIVKPLAVRFQGWVLPGLSILVVWLTPFLWPLQPDRYPLQLVFAFVAGTSSWSYFPLFPWLGYVLAGMWLRGFLNRYPSASLLAGDSRSLFIIVPFMVLLTITFPWASGITRNLEGVNSYYHHGLAFFGWVMMFITVYGFMVRHFVITCSNRKVVMWIRKAGEKVTLVYAVQWIIIGNLATNLFRSVEISGYLFWLGATLVMTSVISAGYLKFRSLLQTGIHPSLTFSRFRKKR